MDNHTQDLQQGFVQGMSRISRFWGFPKGVGALFGLLYLSPTPLSLDELVRRSGLTKGAVSTDVRALARLGLVHRSTKLGDRKDYYQAETDFYKSIRAILAQRQQAEFALAVESVQETLKQLRAAKGQLPESERKFLLQRIEALQDFFDAIDSLAAAVTRLEGLGSPTVRRILSILK